MRRFIFVVTAAALFLATVVPGMSVNAYMTGSAPAVAMTAMDGMDCPSCDTSRDNMVGCVQVICIGFAVTTEDEHFDVSITRPAFVIAATAWPDDFKSTPSTPPI